MPEELCENCRTNVTTHGAHEVRRDLGQVVSLRLCSNCKSECPSPSNFGYPKLTDDERRAKLEAEIDAYNATRVADCD